MKELILYKQSEIKSARMCDRAVLEEELTDMEITLRLLELAEINDSKAE